MERMKKNHLTSRILNTILIAIAIAAASTPPDVTKLIPVRMGINVKTLSVPVNTVFALRLVVDVVRFRSSSWKSLACSNDAGGV